MKIPNEKLLEEVRDPKLRSVLDTFLLGVLLDHEIAPEKYGEN